ncbi:MAG: rRNA maturation RNase YbeY [Clostridia bacterium]|nr:rRNA maturation RNase YbeY [Clostridia bacterium]MBQ2248843.1 rRNA maturation RNase YbeY [Clostridia bacterium]MBQ5613162.1 rRNA maturation RNase YbeY [Clostridia bacterium]MBQ5661700.1 rRNA maturation RNase YbeY [Clostridia bacterium]MBQ5772695.1 rRNA maturation RNase YbeY [Clostridia bacterium]
MKLKVAFDNAQESRPVTYKMKMLVRNAIEATLDEEQYENPCEVSVTFTDNEGIHALNRQYRGVDRPTDVLSFPLFDYEGTSEEPPVDEWIGILGDIVLSLEQAEKQAEEFGHSFEREVAFLCVHSMLHLLGYDHETGEEDEREMRAKQTKIMSALGLAVDAKG